MLGPRWLHMHRHKHREEVQRLKAELLSLQSSSKGGSQAADRSKKDLDKTRCAEGQGLSADVITRLGWHCLVQGQHSPNIQRKIVHESRLG